jgi:hypothetical protein
MMPEAPQCEREQGVERERGFGPVLVDGEGSKRQVTETEALDAAAFTAGLLIAMAAWDFSAHDEWTLGAAHYWFGSGVRMIVRIAGFACAAAIWIMVAREALARERDARRARELNGRSFVSGQAPGCDHE